MYSVLPTFLVVVYLIFIRYDFPHVETETVMDIDHQNSHGYPYMHSTPDILLLYSLHTYRHLDKFCILLNFSAYVMHHCLSRVLPIGLFMEIHKGAVDEIGWCS